MSGYKIYYSIKSQNLHRAIDDAIVVHDTDVVFQLIKKLVSKEDVISIYVLSSKVRVQIWGDSSPGCVLEIHDGRKGCYFEKRILKNDLSNLNSELIETYTQNPEEYGFISTSF